MARFTFRLTHKIISISILGVLGVLAVGGFYLFGDATQLAFRRQADSARAVAELQNRVLVTLLESRRAEKDFLLRKDEKYVEQHRKSSKVVLENLEQLRVRAADLGQSSLTPNLDTLQKGYADYEAHFQALAAARISLGLTDEAGLEGSLRRSVHAIET